MNFSLTPISLWVLGYLTHNVKRAERHAAKFLHLCVKKYRCYLLDDRDLSQVSSSATLYQRDISCQTHPVDMVTGSWGGNTWFYLPHLKALAVKEDISVML